MENSRLYIFLSERLTLTTTVSNLFFFCLKSLLYKALLANGGCNSSLELRFPLSPLASQHLFALRQRHSSRSASLDPLPLLQNLQMRSGLSAVWRCFSPNRPAGLKFVTLVAALYHWGAGISREEVHPAPVGIPTTVSQSPSVSVLLPFHRCL